MAFEVNSISVGFEIPKSDQISFLLTKPKNFWNFEKLQMRPESIRQIESERDRNREIERGRDSLKLILLLL